MNYVPEHYVAKYNGKMVATSFGKVSSVPVVRNMVEERQLLKGATKRGLARVIRGLANGER